MLLFFFFFKVIKIALNQEYIMAVALLIDYFHYRMLLEKLIEHEKKKSNFCIQWHFHQQTRILVFGLFC